MKRLSCFFKSKLFSLTLFLQLNLLLSLSENHYGDCLSKKCGDFDITYPFYIIDQQKSYCGYPGFEVSCNNLSVPLLNISRNSYVIKSISYDLQQFEVVNSVFDNDGGAIAARTICFDLVRNVSWERDIFQFAGHHNKVFLFRNCSEKAIQEYKLSRVKCGGIAVDGKDSKLKNIQKECNKLNVTTVPYYDEGVSADVDNNITHTLERGMLLNWRAYNCTACVETGGQCGFDVVNNQFNCYCRDRTHALHCTQRKLKSRLTGILVVTGSASLGIVFVFAVIIISAKRRQRKRGFTLEWRKEAKRNQNVEAFLKNYGSLAPKRYTHAEIRKMTDNFKEKLGEGGYGVVYKGQLLEHSRFVAVKKLKKLKADGDDFLNEVVSISRTNHVNIVSLLGFCFEGNKRALVYDFMPNGSLEKFINSEGSGQSLPPVTLFGIALGIAKGLDYLHRGCNMRILHFDIKPHNILLDKELRPKISDFGLARLCSTDDSLLSLMEARGTIGYIAPEVFCRNFGGVSHKSDVYSYGMMLLDMVCGRKNIAVVRPQQSSEEYFPDWIYHQLEFQEEIDEIRNNQEQELRRKMILVGLWCIQSYPSNRPPMNRVIEMLEGPLSLLQIPPKPHLSSTPHSVLDASGTASITSMEYSIS